MTPTSLTLYQKSFSELLKARKNALENFLSSEENARRFMSSAMLSLQSAPELENCSQDSLIGAFMECASLGLFPSTASGDCWVLPYKGKAQFQMGYRGFKTLAFRSGIKRMGSEIVYENDKFEELLGTDQRIFHKRATGERGTAIGAYAWCEISDGNTVFKYMDKRQIMKIKEMSQAKDSKYSPWNSGDPELWMWQKTAVKQLAKLLPTSDKLDKAIHLDDVSEGGGYIEGEGEIVEMPFEDSLDARATAEIEAIMDLPELKAYQEKNKGKGKLFDKAIVDRKKQITKNAETVKEPTKSPAKEPEAPKTTPENAAVSTKEVAEAKVVPAEEKKVEAPAKGSSSTLEDDIASTVCKSILESKDIPELKKRYGHFEKTVAGMKPENQSRVMEALEKQEVHLKDLEK